MALKEKWILHCSHCLQVVVRLRDVSEDGSPSTSTGDGQQTIWDVIWKCPVPQKVRKFGWRAATDNLATN